MDNNEAREILIDHHYAKALINPNDLRNAIDCAIQALGDVEKELTYLEASELFDKHSIKSDVLIPVMDSKAFLRALKEVITIKP